MAVSVKLVNKVPAPDTLDQGHELFSTRPLPDGGILNIRIGRDMVYPLADDLIAASVPLIFASSESRASTPQKYACVPLLGKPVDMMIATKQLFPAP